jgi:sterol 3beta-glucosyltransferase
MAGFVFAAVQACGVRVLVSQGLGASAASEAIESIFMLSDCPHDWLFEKVSCVVHHGGGGDNSFRY